MTWTRLDDRWDYGSKLIRAGSMLRSDAPALVWARAVTHCNRELTDGRIHGAVLRSFTFDRRPQRVIDALVIVGALDRVGDDEYQVHDFLDWNDSRAEVEAKRQAKQSAGKIGGTRSGTVRRGEAEPKQVLRGRFASGSEKLNPSPSPLLSNLETPHLPPAAAGPAEVEPPAEVLGLSASPTGGGEVETQQPSSAAPALAAEPDQPAAPLAAEAPDAAEAKPAPKAPKAARASRCPTSVDPAAPAWLADRGIPSLTSGDGPEVAKMLDYFAAQGGQRGAKVDWPATWRNWRREAERRGGRSAPWARPVEPYVPPPRRAPPPPIDDRDDLPPF